MTRTPHRFSWTVSVSWAKASCTRRKRRWICPPKWVTAQARKGRGRLASRVSRQLATRNMERSEEHTSELQSRENLVCRLLLEKKKKDGKGGGIVAPHRAGAR